MFSHPQFLTHINEQTTLFWKILLERFALNDLPFRMNLPDLQERVNKFPPRVKQWKDIRKQCVRRRLIQEYHQNHPYINLPKLLVDIQLKYISNQDIIMHDDVFRIETIRFRETDEQYSELDTASYYLSESDDTESADELDDIIDV
jgi:hypothetical protein